MDVVRSHLGADDGVFNAIRHVMCWHRRCSPVGHVNAAMQHAVCCAAMPASTIITLPMLSVEPWRHSSLLQQALTPAARPGLSLLTSVAAQCSLCVSFRCCRQLEDEQGLRGILLQKNVVAAASLALKTNITNLAPVVLPIAELVPDTRCVQAAYISWLPGCCFHPRLVGAQYHSAWPQAQSAIDARLASTQAPCFPCRP